MKRQTPLQNAIAQLDAEALIEQIVKAHRGTDANVWRDVPPHLLEEVMETMDDFLSFLQDQLPLGESAPATMYDVAEWD